MSPPDHQYDVTALLAQRTWLLRLARALVGRDAAEDLVQDTLITALEKPPRSPLALRAWLSRVIRHKASNYRRGAQRRRRREVATARPESVDEEQILEQAEIQTRIGQALSTLGREERVLLLRRFYAEQSPQSIAEELGLPASTIRTRIQRALERLRRKLDHADSSWRATCLLWLESAIPSADLAGKTILLMNVKKLLALFVLMTLLGWGGYELFERTVPSQTTRDRTANSSATKTSSDSGDPEDESSSPNPRRTVAKAPLPPEHKPEATSASTIDRVARVGGRIWLSSGESLEGDKVRIGPRGQYVSSIDAEGRFAIDCLEELDRAVYLDRNGVQTLVDKVQARFSSDTWLEIEVEVGELLETRLVSSVDQTPVSGASVWLYKETHTGQASVVVTESGPTGLVRAEFLSSDQYLLRIDHPEFRQAEIAGRPAELPPEVELLPAERLEIEFINWPGGEFEWIQFHFHTAGIAERRGVVLNVTEVARNVDSSRVEIRSPGPGAWSVSLSAPGDFPRVTRRVRLDAPQSTSVRLELPALGNVRVVGELRDGVGRAIPQAGIAIGPRSTNTDSKGQFEIGGLTAGERHRVRGLYGQDNDRIEYPLEPITIAADAPGGKRGDGERIERVDLSLAGSLALEVEIADLPGSTVAEFITVSLAQLESHVTAFAVWTTGESCLFEHLPAGRYRVEVKIGSEPLATQFVEVARNHQRLIVPYLEPARLVLNVEGAPAGGFSLISRETKHGPRPPALTRNKLLAEPEHRTWVALTNQRGLATIPPGDLELSISGSGIQPWTGRVELGPGDETTLNIQLNPR